MRGVLPWCPPSGAIKIASWGALRSLLGRFWAPLVPSWGLPGPFLGHYWAILAPSWGIRNASDEKRRESSYHYL
eukprot:8890885-Pyramimonas_sp.AAC.1